MNKPAVTVIIAVKNGQDTMAKCLDSILACKYDDFEVIVVNDASTDKTAAILAGYGQRCKIITHETCTGPAKARNEAVAGASGELVAFTDADCLVNKNWLKELLTVFADT